MISYILYTWKNLEHEKCLKLHKHATLQQCVLAQQIFKLLSDFFRPISGSVSMPWKKFVLPHSHRLSATADTATAADRANKSQQQEDNQQQTSSTSRQGNKKHIVCCCIVIGYTHQLPCALFSRELITWLMMLSLVLSKLLQHESNCFNIQKSKSSAYLTPKVGQWQGEWMS